MNDEVERPGAAEWVPRGGGADGGRADGGGASDGG
ncbi:MAG: hypothetical protein JWR01_1597, partial [Subtercola sp.]|nr:hypothetical protein [Subtercola sp.]